MIKIFIILFLIIALLVITWFFFVKDKTGPILQNKIESFTVAEKNRVSGNLEKLYKQVNPANFYTQDFNTPNFTSNVMDLRKFYSYDNPPGGTIEKVPKDDSNDSIIEDVKTDPAWLIPKQKIGNHLEPTSNYWNYKNEMPMNGGDFGGLSGYEGIGGTYSVFNAKQPLEDTSDLHHSDDLRNGKGFPQKQEFRFNMSNV